MNIKKVILFFNLFFLFQMLSAQSFQGTWKINQLITNPETEEYILYPKDKGFSENYGLHITLENNGFVTSYSAPCGNDCFTTSVGKYEMTDENHIRFSIEKISYRGCRNRKEEQNFPLDAGLFYIHKNENKIFMIKSNGNISEDIKNVEYSHLVTSKYEESKKFENLLTWQYTDFTSAKSDAEIVDFFVLKNNINSCQILYSKDVDYNLSVILLKINNNFRYLFCNKSYSENFTKMVNQVALFDEDTLETIHHSVDEIDNNKALTVKNIDQDQDVSGFKKIVTTFKNNDQLVKVNIKYIHTSGTSVTDIYVRNNDPFYIKITQEMIFGPKNLVSSTAFYVTGKNRFVSKELLQEGTSISQSAFYTTVQDLETILAEQNKNSKN